MTVEPVEVWHADRLPGCQEPRLGMTVPAPCRQCRPIAAAAACRRTRPPGSGACDRKTCAFHMARQSIAKHRRDRCLLGQIDETIRGVTGRRPFDLLAHTHIGRCVTSQAGVPFWPSRSATER